MNKPIRACGRDEAQTAETGGEPAFTCLPCPALPLPPLPANLSLGSRFPSWRRPCCRCTLRFTRTDCPVTPSWETTNPSTAHSRERSSIDWSAARVCQHHCIPFQSQCPAFLQHECDSVLGGSASIFCSATYSNRHVYSTQHTMNMRPASEHR